MKSYKNKKKKIEKLKTQIQTETLTKKELISLKLYQEDQYLLAKLKNENCYLVAENLGLNQKIEQIKSTTNEHTQKEAILKYKIEVLQRKNKNRDTNNRIQVI